jgi:hypothetical protein
MSDNKIDNVTTIIKKLNKPKIVKIRVIDNPNNNPIITSINEPIIESNIKSDSNKSEIDIVIKKIKTTNNLCKICNKTPSYGYIGTKATHCSLCKLDSMINLKHKKCEVCKTKIASCGLPGTRATHCGKCKLESMINTICRKCEECRISTPSFGFIGDKKTHCGKCKLEFMIDLKNPICTVCEKTHASYGYDLNEKATHCSKCKLEFMINISNSKCSVCNDKYSEYGIKGTFATHCFKCKLDSMIRLKYKTCQVCNNVLACFGYIGKKPTHCSPCKLENMINIRETKCCVCKKKQVGFGYIGGKLTHCGGCKLESMVDLKNRMCEGCNNIQPSFGYIGGKPTHCTACKLEFMEFLTHPRCINCNVNMPSYGYKNDTKATFCKKCHLEGMINLLRPMCKICENWIDPHYAIKKLDDYCSRCFQQKFPLDPRTQNLYSKTKEIIVRDFINIHYDGFQHDKPLEYAIDCDCNHNRRVDHRKLFKNTMLCIETDENQHKFYNREDEMNRYHDLFMAFSCKFIFIRFNPDKYKNSHGNIRNPDMANRLDELKTMIDNQIERIECEVNTEPLEVHYLFFDEN